MIQVCGKRERKRKRLSDQKKKKKQEVKDVKGVEKNAQES